MTKKEPKPTFIANNKIQYVPDCKYILELPFDTPPDLKEGTLLKEKGIIKRSDAKKTSPKIHEIEYKGSVSVSVGQKVGSDDVIAVAKGGFRKVQLKANVNGIVTEILEDKIIIEEIVSSSSPEISVIVPFDSKISKVLKNKLLLEFPAVVVNLVSVKGSDVIGPLYLLSLRQIRAKEYAKESLGLSIVVTDQLGADAYPILSTLGVLGMVANSTDAILLDEIILISASVGIISGFGVTNPPKKETEIEPILKEDDVLTNYLKSRQSKTVWLDTLYQRLIIPEPKEPAFIKKHKFDLDKMGIVW